MEFDVGPRRRHARARSSRCGSSPPCDLRDGLIVRAEALLRWRHPDARPAAAEHLRAAARPRPARSCRSAGSTIADACQSLAAWRRGDAAAHGDAHLGEPVARQFLAPDLVSQLTRGGDRRAGLARADLEVEIGELEAMTHYERPSRCRRRIARAPEFKVALDDFGLGLAATEHIRGLGVHTLKIDRSYIGGNPASRRQRRRSCSTRSNWRRSCGIDVVAEGVETPTELDALQQLELPARPGVPTSRAPCPPTSCSQLLQRDAAAPAADWWAGAAAADHPAPPGSGASQPAVPHRGDRGRRPRPGSFGTAW